MIEFLRGPLTMEQVNDFILAVNSHSDKHGYTLWALEDGCDTSYFQQLTKIFDTMPFNE